jgi:hypothetical protein
VSLEFAKLRFGRRRRPKRPWHPLFEFLQRNGCPNACPLSGFAGAHPTPEQRADEICTDAPPERLRRDPLISSDPAHDDLPMSTTTPAVVGYRRLSPTAEMSSANSRPSSFFGAAYCNDAVGVIAFRGSAERTDWLDADADIGMGNLPIDQWGDATSRSSSRRAPSSWHAAAAAS